MPNCYGHGCSGPDCALSRCAILLMPRAVVHACAAASATPPIAHPNSSPMCSSRDALQALPSGLASLRSKATAGWRQQQEQLPPTSPRRPRCPCRWQHHSSGWGQATPSGGGGGNAAGSRDWDASASEQALLATRRQTPRTSRLDVQGRRAVWHQVAIGTPGSIPKRRCCIGIASARIAMACASVSVHLLPHRRMGNLMRPRGRRRLHLPMGVPPEVRGAIRSLIRCLVAC